MLRASLLLLALPRPAAAFSVCRFNSSRSPQLVFFHVPKCGGMTVSRVLKSAGCQLFLGTYNQPLKPNTTLFELDAMHVTPGEAGYYARRNFLPHLPHEVLESLPSAPSFTFVRNPYLRVLSAFNQRVQGGYDGIWGSDYPRRFAEFMEELFRGLRAGDVAWMTDGSLTHFRPATLYTHWPDHTPVRNMRWGKLEALGEDWPSIFASLAADVEARGDAGTARMLRTSPFDSAASLGWVNRRGDRERTLCSDATGCAAHELDDLLRQTEHTARTVAIVNELYAADFALLNYTKLELPPAAE